MRSYVEILKESRKPQPDNTCYLVDNWSYAVSNAAHMIDLFTAMMVEALSIDDVSVKSIYDTYSEIISILSTSGQLLEKVSEDMTDYLWRNTAESDSTNLTKE